MGTTQVLPGILQKHCCILPDRNTGQATIVRRLRSSQRHQGRHSAYDGQQSFSTSGTERRGRRARAPPHHRGQERSTGRSRSPIRRASLESLRTTGHSSQDDEQASGSSAITITLEYQLPDTILQSDTTREVRAPGSESATTTTVFRFGPQLSISLIHRPRQLPATTTRESHMNASHERSGSLDIIIEYQPANPIPPRGRFSEGEILDNILNIVRRQQGMRRPMSQVQPQAPPAQNSAYQEQMYSQPSRRTLQIDTFPTRTITSQEDIGSCVICMTEYETGEQVTMLPCNHNYHRCCILPWLQSNPTCPLCRNNCFR
ncbi:uncharacterized protein [Dendrobates tinctorius]|uniref:uncharacterized protein isoform X1 n=1 Tax=Dendrobates tinctorius TaxID=92724 RepID=UPI003CCA1468